MNDKKNKQEKVTDIKGTIIGFVAPDPEEKTQEQEIENFKIKKETEKSLTCMDDLFNGFKIMLFRCLGNREKPWSFFRGNLKVGSAGGQKREAT